MHNDYGHFSSKGKEYIIKTRQTPRHWYNYLWNNDYVSLVSQVGQGESLAQDSFGRRIHVAARRMIFIYDVDRKNYWSANALGFHRDINEFECTHGLGYSNISLETEYIASSFRIFVPIDGLMEIWTLRIRNLDNKIRNLKIFPFVDTYFDGVDKPQAYYNSKSDWNDDLQGVSIRKFHQFENSEECSVFMTSNRIPAGYDTRQRAFIGFGTFQNPDALRNGKCLNSNCETEKPILALEHEISLAPEEETEIHFILGAVNNENEYLKIRKRFFTDNAINQEFALMQQTVNEELGDTSFKTPDKTLNYFTSNWLKRQISLGTVWARVRHNGYRDLTQDIGAYVFIHPEKALERFKRVLSFQYSNGFAPRTWIDGKIFDHDFSDNHVWIAYTAYNLVCETGNIAILDIDVPFNDGSSASIYEHVKRSVDYIWEDRGLFGLPCIHSGDWNDCINNLGKKGMGVSVWLAMAWCRANKQLGELAFMRGDYQYVAITKKRAEEMTDNIDRHAWDGKYYLRAFSDNGTPLGSNKNNRASMFLNTQTWAVLSGITRGGKDRLAMEAVDRFLDSEIGTLSVLSPFDKYTQKIGSMSTKSPGIQENGGVYLHASAFRLVAECMLKRRDRVEAEIHKMLPFDETYHTKKTVEPYVFCNSYNAIDDQYYYGLPTQSWCTGTAGWFYYALLTHVFGLKPELDGLRVDPCLPPSWKECGVKRAFRTAVYNIKYYQNGKSGDVAEIIVDDRTLDSNILPYRENGKFKVEIFLT